jgi:hypothetical protein
VTGHIAVNRRHPSDTTPSPPPCDGWAAALT